MITCPNREALVKKTIGVLFFLFLLEIHPRPGLADDLSSEQEAIQKAAKQYLEAEVQRNYKAIYACLAPSSEYVAANTFEAYLAEAKSSPVRIVSYQILNISQIRDNPDKKKYPKFDRMAQVEVDVVVLYADTSQRSMVNYAFPFVKEGGKWYKL